MENNALNILMVAGETSGDMHAASLAAELLKLRPGISLWGMGGGAMNAAGVAIEQPMDSVEVMGLVEVLGALGDVRSAIQKLVRMAAECRPAAAVLTDFADFNLRLAKRLKEMGIPVVYFISPKVWAWRKGRVKVIRRLVDLMLLILPFEEEFYRGLGMDRVRYVGSPLVDQLQPVLERDEADIRKELDVGANETVIGVLPGSRPNEIKQHGRVLAEGALMAAKNARLRAEKAGGITVLAAPPAGEKAELLQSMLKDLPVRLVPGKARELLRISRCAVIKCGTGTLEAAILETPAVVAYRVSLLTYLIARPLVHLKHGALPNIIAGKEVYPEILQRITPAGIAEKIVPLWEGEERSRMLDGLREVKGKLGPPGAVRRAAEAVSGFIDDKARS